jgi:hypothetical protein
MILIHAMSAVTTYSRRPLQVEDNGAGASASIFGDWLADAAKSKMNIKGQYCNTIAPMIVRPCLDCNFLQSGLL